MKRWNKKQSGFSMVELSVVLSIIGVTLGGALSLAIKKTEAEKIEETTDKMAKIDTAMNVYLAQNQRLPCPAPGALAFTAAGFGVAGAASESGGNGVCASANFDNTAAAGQIYAGVVPTKTLGLPDDTMIDGWGRRIVYAIDARFANNATTNASCDNVTSTACFKYTPNGSMVINDSAGNPRTSSAVYALISQGKNGKGAWSYAGSATRVGASTDADEMTNAGNDSGSFTGVFVQKDADGTFDDVVVYRNKWQIMDEADTITDTDLCQFAGPADVRIASCAGAANVTMCEALASKVDALCLDM